MAETEFKSQGDLVALFAAVEKINHRLDKLETDRPRPAVNVSKIPRIHSSMDKLNIAEAIADSLFSDNSKEKGCIFEPDKPCDHCSMCNSRGF